MCERYTDRARRVIFFARYDASALATNEVAPQPKEAFPKLADFLRQLEDRRAAYHVSAFNQEAIRVEVALPEQKWVVTFRRRRPR
jgi:hypothetical protein